MVGSAPPDRAWAPDKYSSAGRHLVRVAAHACGPVSGTCRSGLPTNSRRAARARWARWRDQWRRPGTPVPLSSRGSCVAGDEGCGFRGVELDAESEHAAYQQILTVFTDTGRPMRARDLCQALDLPIVPKNTEGICFKLKCLVSRGILTEPEFGLFTQPHP
ncbi:hypothetical protein Slala03_54490 [Streptomyces lavendulae subsp. lavendulae]|nr:hypothetical protein Slala03_54490 [Streptomyces lavendulae subsp. lavendulae]